MGVMHQSNVGHIYKNEERTMLLHNTIDDSNSKNSVSNELSIRAYFVFFLLCVSMLFQSLISQGVTGLVSIELEKRYGYPTLYSGIIIAGNEMMPFLFGPVIAFYGNRGFRLKWISLGILIIGIGALLFSLPHFVFPAYAPTISTDLKLESQVCTGNPMVVCPMVTPKGASLMSFLALALFFVSQLTMGAGSIPLHVLGPTYIDDNTPKKYFPYFYGIWSLSWLGGPLIGLVVGSGALLLWIDHPKSALVLMSDPRWLGAWWIPYLIFGTLLILLGIILLVFHLKSNDDDKRNVQMKIEKDLSSPEGTKLNLRLLRNILDVLKNPMFAFCTLGRAFRMFLIYGQAAFLPKILAEVFNEPPTKSGFILALVIGSSVIMSIVVTTKLTKLLERRSLLSWLFLVCAFGSLYTSVHSSTILAPIGCLTPTIVGINQMVNESIVDKNKFCNSHCTCSEIYEPVCGSDGKTYFSSCYAGCNNASAHRTKSGFIRYSFENCSCVQSQGKEKKTATVGSCVSSCPHFYTFVILTAIFSFFSLAAAIPNDYIILRYVSVESRSIAIAVQSVIIRILCSIPSPMVFGKAIDKTCIAWSPATKILKDSGCIGIGTMVCRNYSIEALKKFIALIGLVCGLSSFIFYIIGFSFAKRNDEKKT